MQGTEPSLVSEVNYTQFKDGSEQGTKGVSFTSK